MGDKGKGRRVKQPYLSSLSPLRAHLISWFTESALPTWAERGVDRVQGGFFERVDEAGRPLEGPRRTRVVSRQIYVFCVANRLGWSGPAQREVLHGLDFLIHRLRRPDGLFHSAVHADGSVADSAFDLYEQAFALFALASAAHYMPSEQPRLAALADESLDALDTLYRHPIGGYREQLGPGGMLRANPHMHLLEAALSWEAVSGASPRWASLSDELAKIAMAYMVDPHVGCLYEHFTDDWTPVAQDGFLAVEPGHQFEWAWLLSIWGLRRKHKEALLMAERIFLSGTRGVCVQRGVAVNSMDPAFEFRDANAKLWPQTEWIKASHVRALSSQGHDVKMTIDAGRALCHYLSHPIPGLWREVMAPSGALSTEPCRASSLYHIVCAIDTLSRDQP